MMGDQGVLSVKSVSSLVDKEKYARCDTAPMLRAREASCSIKFQSREWGQLWGRKINHINFTFNIIYLRVKYGGGTVSSSPIASVINQVTL